MAIKWFDGLGDINRFDILRRLKINDSGSLEIDGSPVQSSGNGLLVYTNVDELKAAYPNGANQPAWITSESSWYYWDGTVTPPTDTTAPTVSILPISGTYTGSQQITLSSNESATIYYTTDGSTPTTSSTVYSAPFTVSATATVKYFGLDSAGNQSTIQTANFTINVLDTTAPNPVTNLVAGTPTTTSIPVTWTKSTSVDVANYEVAHSTDGTNFTVASNAINSSSTSYTINGLTSNTNYTIRVVAIDSSNNRSTAVTVTATTAVPTDTTPPTNVTNLVASNVTDTSLTLTWTASVSSDIASYDVYQGSTLLGNTTSTTYNVSGLIASTSYTFTVKAKDMNGNVSTGISVTESTMANAPANDTTPPTITANPVGGAYTSAQSVTLTSDETATIYYTVDGTDPTTSSSVYSTPISVSVTAILKYFGVDGAGNQSAIQTQTYTINNSTGVDVTYVDTGMLVVPFDSFSWALNNSYSTANSTVINMSQPLSSLFDISTLSTAINFGSFVYVSSPSNLTNNTFTIYNSEVFVMVDVANGSDVNGVISYLKSVVGSLRIKLAANYQVFSISSNISGTTTKSATTGFEYFKCNLLNGIGTFSGTGVPYKYFSSNGYYYQTSYVWTYTAPCIKVNSDSTLEMLLPNGTLTSIDDAGVISYLSNASIEIYYV